MDCVDGIILVATINMFSTIVAVFYSMYVINKESNKLNDENDTDSDGSLYNTYIESDVEFDDEDLKVTFLEDSSLDKPLYSTDVNKVSNAIDVGVLLGQTNKLPVTVSFNKISNYGCGVYVEILNRYGKIRYSHNIITKSLIIRLE